MLEVDKIYCMDCLHGMKQLEDNAVEAVITDPPYGLEFMGKEWDKFEPKRLGQRWAGKDRKLIGDGTGKGGDFGDRFNEMPKSIPKKNKRCKKCGHYFFSGDPCKCKNPEWEIDTQYVNAFQDFCYTWAVEVLRVLKPGGYLLSFGGSRTYHRMACAIEDAGFEIRDQIMWVYGSGFPKSMDISKAIDKMKGAERSIIGKNKSKGIRSGQNHIVGDEYHCDGYDVTVPSTPEAKQWAGWGTALKPAHEPIVMARKGLSEKTVAENVLRWSVGGINIDGCIVPFVDEADKEEAMGKNQHADFNSNDGVRVPTKGIYHGDFRPPENYTAEKGRFPANLIHDGSKEVLDLFPDSKSTGGKSGHTGAYSGGYKEEFYGDLKPGFGDSGSAARFFYCAKASKDERNIGCEKLKKTSTGHIASETGGGGGWKNDAEKNPNLPRANYHPTVKPVELMKYLIKLITKENQLVLDPFIGSGSTALACRWTNRRFIGFEINQEYYDIANKRLSTIPKRLESFT